MTHLYTLVIRNDNTFEILVDLESKKKGSLLQVSPDFPDGFPTICLTLVYCRNFMILQDMEPSINPPKEIDDPKDFKPSDWVDEEMIDDPEAKKPDGRTAYIYVVVVVVVVVVSTNNTMIYWYSSLQTGMNHYLR
jgi:hypothetical protein